MSAPWNWIVTGATLPFDERRRAVGAGERLAVGELQPRALEGTARSVTGAAFCATYQVALPAVSYM